MSVELVLELSSRKSAQTVLHALDAYKTRLRASIQRTHRNLTNFEQRYGIKTEVFLREMVAEDLPGGDLEYIDWAGEAKILEGLETELRELEDVRFTVP